MGLASSIFGGGASSARRGRQDAKKRLELGHGAAHRISRRVSAEEIGAAAGHRPPRRCALLKAALHYWLLEIASAGSLRASSSVSLPAACEMSITCSGSPMRPGEEI